MPRIPTLNRVRQRALKAALLKWGEGFYQGKIRKIALTSIVYDSLVPGIEFDVEFTVTTSLITYNGTVVVGVLSKNALDISRIDVSSEDEKYRMRQGKQLVFRVPFDSLTRIESQQDLAPFGWTPSCHPYHPDYHSRPRTRNRL